MKGDSERPAESQLDYSDLLARMENDQDLVRDLLRIFQEEFPRALRSLQDAVTDGDMKKVETSGHTLKGMLAMLAFGRAAQTAKNVEMLGKQRTPAGLPELLTALERETSLAVAELESHCIEPRQ